MRNSTAEKFFVTAVLILNAAPAAAADRLQGRGVGSGVAYAAPNQGTIVNPASLVDADDGVSASGLWRFESGTPMISGAAAYQTLGVGAAYRKQGDANVYEGGFGASLGQMASLGATVRSIQGGGLDGDLGASFDFGNLRIAGVARGLSGGVDRIDAGLGVRFANVVIEGDVKKLWPMDSDAWAFDTSITASVNKVSVGVGYDFSRSAGAFQAGDLHAGVSLNVVDKAYLEAHYRLLAQEIGEQDWTAGIRYVF